MKTLMMAATALFGAGLIAPALSAPAAAQTYRTAPASAYEQCIAEQRQRQVAGAVIGGILGAVVGAELHDESQDRDRERRYRHYDRYDRYDRYGDYGLYDRRYRHRHREEGNDGAVVAGTAVGALAGAAIASGDCERLRQRGYGYGQTGYGHDPYADPYYGAGGDGYGYQDPYYEDPYHGDRYHEDSRRWSTDEELLGGQGYGGQTGYDARRYSTGPAITASSPYGADCRYMSSAGRSTLMCQGADGIWRPADSYR